jgi:hypothetical protein
MERAGSWAIVMVAIVPMAVVGISGPILLAEEATAAAPKTATARKIPKSEIKDQKVLLLLDELDKIYTVGDVTIQNNGFDDVYIIDDASNQEIARFVRAYTMGGSFMADASVVKTKDGQPIAYVISEFPVPEACEIIVTLNATVTVPMAEHISAKLKK